MSKIAQILNKIFQNRFFRFLIAGGVNALFGYGCFAVLMYLIGIKEIAVTLNYIIAIFFNYITSSRFVFKDKSMKISQIIKFYLVYLITYPLNLLHVHITVDILHWNVYLSQFATLLYLPIISFLLQRKLVFSDK